MEAYNNDSDCDVFSDEFYSNAMDKEKIADTWFLMGSPWPITAILSLYLLVVLKIGPWFMRDREPYNIKNAMRIYNIVQVLYNAAVLYIFLTPIPHGNIKCPIWFLVSHSCSDPRFVNTFDDSMRYLFLTVCWYILGLKLIDLMDTIFMVMRKKYSHITVLHVYHHASTVFLVWFSIKYIKAVQGALPVFINLIVHFIMYGYYFLATFDTFKSFLWWKSHLTKLQLVQLVVVLTYLAGLFYNQCPVSKKFTYIWLLNVAANIILFTNFYVRAYILKPKPVEPSQKSK